MDHIVKKYIGFHCTDAIIKRGTDLFLKGAVSNEIFDKEHDRVFYSVKGGSKYKVVIENPLQTNMDTTCNCPYDWSSVCKHKVAALLYLDSHKEILFANYRDSGSGKPAKTKLKAKSGAVRKFTTEYFPLGDGSQVNTNWIISKLLNSSLAGRYYNYLNLYSEEGAEIIKLERDKMVFRLLSVVGDNNASIEIEDKQGGFFIKLSSRRKCGSLTDEEAVLLNIIANLKHFDLFSLFKEKKHLEIPKNLLTSYGLDSGLHFFKYFELFINIEKGITYSQKPIIRGLIPVNGKITAPLLDAIKDISRLDSPSRISTPIMSAKKAGFVIDIFKSQGYYATEREMFDWFEITTVLGQPFKRNPDKLSGLSFYEDANRSSSGIALSNNQLEIIKLGNSIKEINRKSKNSESPALFNLLTKAFELLSGEKYVYIGSCAQHGRINKSNIQECKISDKTLDLAFHVENPKGFYKLKHYLKLEDRLIDPGDDELRSYYYFSHFNGYVHLHKSMAMCAYLTAFDAPPMMSSEHQDLFFDKLVKPLAANFSFDFNGIKGFSKETQKVKAKKKQIFLSEQDNLVVLKPMILYSNKMKSAVLSNSKLVSAKENKLVEYSEQTDYKASYKDFMLSAHPSFREQRQGDLFYLSIDQMLEDDWFIGFFEKCLQEEIEVFGIDKLSKLKYSPFRAKTSTSIKSGIDWFDIEINISFGDEVVDLKTIKAAIQARKTYVKLSDGSIGRLPEKWLEQMKRFFRNGLVEDSKIKISKLRFSIIDTLFKEINDKTVLKELYTKKKLLKNAGKISRAKVPNTIKANLRPYQKEGLSWMKFLNKLKWGGILADDMGLGKTIQVLTFLEMIKTKTSPASLIVVPTTLLFNWENEVGKFAPDMNIHFYYGQNKTVSKSKIKDNDLIITTYGLLTRSIKELKKYTFNYVILDESQAIKNPSSQRYKAACLLNAKNRLALTGTPVENGTFDLYAQMNFLNPAMLGSIKNFKEHYSNPIDKDGNKEIAAELQKIVNPFILRRTKEQVATDLPTKTEDVIYCEMEDEQRKIYDERKNAYRQSLMKNIEDEGLGKSKFLVLDALLKLRQICNSPELVNDGEYKNYPSGKLNELIKHITEKTSKHKILVFSQFVSMLGIIKAKLEDLGIQYEYLDGQCTKDQRRDSVAKFQENKDLRVFLISLKAGGTGLNLTEADYVYIFDPWWNPAVEEQAIDRCHRIGQDKKVFAYRMICKDSIEEKITLLQAKKKRIAGDLIKVDDESVLKSMKMDDIETLFG
ncbi:MAG: DEAD/DEAH box helicase family protein [Chlorobi bacterium]|nr:DEAD/DEAH box helicase family protein [Chlorobiota bacterium]